MAIERLSAAQAAAGVVIGPKGNPVFPNTEAAVATARELIPRLRERVPETEGLRRLPDTTVTDLLENGLIDLMGPKIWGGSELPVESIIQVVWTLAEGCPSTAWVYMLWSAHIWMLAQFPEDAQKAVLASQKPIASSVVNTVGTPEVVEGGFRWTARGFFSSGVDHCSWMTPAMTFDAGNGPERWWFLIPRSDIEIVDDWHTVGLKGTGSKTVIFNDVFIPMERTLRVADLEADRSPGQLLHPNVLYHTSSAYSFGFPVGSPSVGIAAAVLKAYEDRARSKLTGSNAAQAAEQTVALLRMAKAAADIDAAKALMLYDARHFGTQHASNFSAADKARARRDMGYASQLARDAADSLFESAGGSAVYDSAEIQRLWRDNNVAAAHHGLQWDLGADHWARVLMELPTIMSLNTR